MEYFFCHKLTCYCRGDRLWVGIQFKHEMFFAALLLQLTGLHSQLYCNDHLQSMKSTMSGVWLSKMYFHLLVLFRYFIYYKTYKIHKIVICSLNAIFPLTILPKTLHLIKSKVKQIVWKVMSSLIFILKVVITTVMWSIYNAHDSSAYNL